MQQKSPSKSTFIILAIIVAVALLLFFYFKGSPSDSSVSSLDTIVTPESAKAQADADKILSLLNEISKLQITTKLFESSVYRSLVDYTITIPDQPVGRDNPFAPVGGFKAPVQVQSPVKKTK